MSICQILGINKLLKGKSHMYKHNVPLLNKAAHASQSSQILSICTLIDDKNEPISTWEIGQF